jgi:hypothetical protein
MSFLTIFTSPKPFTNPHINIIQRNAIQNWKALSPEVEVVMIGDEKGMPGVATEYGVRQIKTVEVNEFGTPYIKSIFQAARESGNSPFMCFANADMLFFPKLVEDIKAVGKQHKKFLIVGQRWDMDITELINFSTGWDQRLKTRLIQDGRLHAPAGSDYFVFHRDQYIETPNFVIGRPSWDNWMIYHGLKQGWPVIDATPDIDIIHQNHDYSHLPGGRPPYGGVEGNQNIAHGKASTQEYYFYLLLDANRQLKDGNVLPNPITWPRLLRKLEVLFAPLDEEGLRFNMFQRIERYRKRVIRERYTGRKMSEV